MACPFNGRSDIDRGTAGGPVEGRTARRAYVAKAEAAAAAAAKAGLRKRLWEAEGARSDLLRRKLLEAEATEAVLRRKLAEAEAVLRSRTPSC